MINKKELAFNFIRVVYFSKSTLDSLHFTFTSKDVKPLHNFYIVLFNIFYVLLFQTMLRFCRKCHGHLQRCLYKFGHKHFCRFRHCRCVSCETLTTLRNIRNYENAVHIRTHRLREVNI